MDNADCRFRPDRCPHASASDVGGSLNPIVDLAEKLLAGSGTECWHKTFVQID